MKATPKAHTARTRKFIGDTWTHVVCPRNRMILWIESEYWIRQRALIIGFYLTNIWCPQHLQLPNQVQIEGHPKSNISEYWKCWVFTRHTAPTLIEWVAAGEFGVVDGAALSLCASEDWGAKERMSAKAITSILNTERDWKNISNMNWKESLFKMVMHCVFEK